MTFRIKADRILPPAGEADWLLKPLSELSLPGFARLGVGEGKVCQRGGTMLFLRAVSPG